MFPTCRFRTTLWAAPFAKLRTALVVLCFAKLLRKENKMFGLAHADFGWIIAGVVAFVGIMFFITKIVRGELLSAMLSGAVWFFVFSMHSGSTQGIMTATFAALLFDMVGLPIINLAKRR